MPHSRSEPSRTQPVRTVVESAQPPPAPHIRHIPAFSQDEEARLEVVNVLVVDDSPSKVVSLKAILTAPDVHILSAQSGDEALRLLLRHEFAVILLDVSMPVLDGLQTAAIIRQRQETAQTPIIFVTAYDSSEQSVGKAYALGAVDFIFAPIIPEILVAKVAVFADLFRKTRQVRRQAETLEARVQERTAALAAEVDERLRAEHDLLTNLNHLKCLSTVTQAIVQNSEPRLALQGVMEAVQSSFQCDRAWLVAATHGTPLRVTFAAERTEHVWNDEAGLPNDIAEMLQEALQADEPVSHGRPGRQPSALRRIGTHSLLAISVRPKLGLRWLLVIQQCAYARQWQVEERALFKDISFRVADALNDLLVQQDLQQSELRYKLAAESYQSLVHSIDGVVWEADPTTMAFKFVSHQTERLLGFDAERWVQEPGFWQSRIHPADREQTLQYCADCLLDGRENYDFEYRFLTATDTIVWLRDYVTIVRPEHGPVRLRGIMVDITERKKSEESLRRAEEQLRQSQRMEAVGRLAGGIAHDFNNLLTAINGYTDVVLRKLEPYHPCRDDLQQVLAAGERAADLTKQLLAYSRKQVLAPKTTSINSIVSDMDRMLRRLIGEEVNLVTVLTPNLLAVNVDPGQLQQVLLNLAVNARDAMPEGGRLTIETSNVDAAPDNPIPHVLVTVTDTGFGMDEQVMAQMFEPFFTTKPLGEGTGLGLSTVYGIVRQSGGQITARSEPGKGTQFSVYLPSLTQVSLMGTPSQGRLDVVQGTETVLVAEDDHAVRKLVSAMLRGAGYHVLVAADGQEALKLADEFAGTIDLLVSDVVMPIMGGRELGEKLRQRRPQTVIMYMSGYTDDELVRHGVRDHAAFFLAKPFAAAALTKMVRQALDAAKRQQLATIQ